MHILKTTSYPFLVNIGNFPKHWIGYVGLSIARNKSLKLVDHVRVIAPFSKEQFPHPPAVLMACCVLLTFWHFSHAVEKPASIQASSWLHWALFPKTTPFSSSNETLKVFQSIGRLYRPLNSWRKTSKNKQCITDSWESWVTGALTLFPKFHVLWEMARSSISE